LSFTDGRLLKLDPASGKELGIVEVAQSLAAGPVSFENRVLLAAIDGTLLFVDSP
jgi:hypothetical protein